jgi:hypothetical protein
MPLGLRAGSDVHGRGGRRFFDLHTSMFDNDQKTHENPFPLWIDPDWGVGALINIVAF